MNEESNEVVKTSRGQVKGTYQNGLYVFKGIPYASPPTGELRWMPPRPHAHWDGVREALSFGPITPQLNWSSGPVKMPGLNYKEPQSEDCLYLNIWTPGLDNGRRPVMFWIHGGGFIHSSGSQPNYWGDVLASRGNIVLVSINYRQGLLGFINLNEVTGGRIPSTGNEGLLDQIVALEWVQDNIIAFGGNPENITVFGESSGGMSIGCLLTMPKARGLFHRAIMESGTGIMARPLDSCVGVSRKFLEAVGLLGSDVKALRDLSIEKILTAQQSLVAQVGQVPTAPVIDGTIIPQPPLEAARAGAAYKIPIMVGTNLEEMKVEIPGAMDIMNLDEAGLVRLCKSIVPEKHVSLLIDTYKNARIKRGESITPYEILYAVKTDIAQWLPAVWLAEAYAEYRQPAYSYIFTWKSPALGGIIGAFHSLELGFVFGKYESSEIYGSDPQVGDLSCKMQDAWIAFAYNGNPSCDSLGNWPTYGKERQVMLLGAECSVAKDPFKEERKVWDIIGEVPMII